MYVRNVDRGYRGVNTSEGTVWLAPNEARDLELVAAEEAVARATGWFAFAPEGVKAKGRKPRKLAAETTS